MNADQVKQITQNISDALVVAGQVAEVLAPQYQPFLVLGIAVAKAMPELEQDIAAFFAGGEPTDEQKQALAQKLAALLNPETL